MTTTLMHRIEPTGPPNPPHPLPTAPPCHPRATASWVDDVCLAQGLSPVDRAALAGIATFAHTLRCGEHLYRAGTPLRALYAIRSGFVKGAVVHHDGAERIVDVHFDGDLVGLDGMDCAVHTRDVVALEDCKVSELAFGSVERLARASPTLQRNLHRALSHEIAHGHRHMLLLGTMQAPQKLASFLLRMSRRMAERHRDPQVISLPMTRAEMGNHLGLTFETVSRTLSRLQRAGVTEVTGKQIRIASQHGLENVVAAAH